MDKLITEWAGKERAFRLRFGEVLDLEQAVGLGIGQVFLDVIGGRFGVNLVYHTIRFGLIGGGMSVLDAKRLLDDQFDAKPLMAHAGLAGAILSSLMTGIEADEDGSDPDESDPSKPYKFSEVVQICRVFHMSPDDLRQMRYADFVNMVRGFNAGSEKQAPHLSEEEFTDILNRYEPVDKDT